jgi:hypothetical protein
LDRLLRKEMGEEEFTLAKTARNAKEEPEEI